MKAPSPCGCSIFLQQGFLLLSQVALISLSHDILRKNEQDPESQVALETMRSKSHAYMALVRDYGQADMVSKPTPAPRPRSSDMAAPSAPTLKEMVRQSAAKARPLTSLGTTGGRKTGVRKVQMLGVSSREALVGDEDDHGAEATGTRSLEEPPALSNAANAARKHDSLFSKIRKHEAAIEG